MSGTELPHEPPPAYEHVLAEDGQATAGQTANGTAAPPLPQRPAAPPAPVASPSSDTTGSRPHGVRPSSASVPEAESRTPTTVPTPNRPLLHNGCVLVYPKGWTRCYKCGNTGYKGGDPTHPCRKCWRHYGRTYSNTLRYAYEDSGNDSASHNGCVLQQPLPPTIGAAPVAGPAPRPPPMPPVPGSFPAPNSGDYSGVAGPFYWGSGYSGATYNLPGPSYIPPPQSPPPPRPLPPRRNSAQVFPEDRYSDAPPNYVMVNKTDKKTRLPHQEYPAEERPRPPPPPMPMPPRPPMPPPPFSHPTGWYGGQPPPGALVVMPGDPRIGCVLCPECGGSGNAPLGLGTILFGVDDECPRCGGAGRVPAR